jgi:hypothetical protein
MAMKNKRFVIPFEDGHAAFAVQVPRRFDANSVAKALGFDQPRPTIYVTGGASAMSPEDMQATRVIVERGLARFAEERNAIVIDGGTQAGIPILIGDGRQKYRYRFPLIGIAPLELVHYPGYENDNPDSAPLNTAHSHFVLTAGDAFGDESDVITQLTYALSGAGEQPAIGILINGGKIAREEVYDRTTSDTLSFPLIVIEGTGRFADILANAFYTGHADDEDLQKIINKGNLNLVRVDDGPEALRARLSAYFDTYKPPAKSGRAGI